MHRFLTHAVPKTPPAWQRRWPCCPPHTRSLALQAHSSCTQNIERRTQRSDVWLLDPPRKRARARDVWLVCFRSLVLVLALGKKKDYDVIINQKTRSRPREEPGKWETLSCERATHRRGDTPPTPICTATCGGFQSSGFRWVACLGIGANTAAARCKRASSRKMLLFSKCLGYPNV